MGLYWIGRAINAGAHASLRLRWDELVEDVAWFLEASQCVLVGAGDGDEGDGGEEDGRPGQGWEDAHVEGL